MRNNYYSDIASRIQYVVETHVSDEHIRHGRVRVNHKLRLKWMLHKVMEQLFSYHSGFEDWRRRPEDRCTLLIRFTMREKFGPPTEMIIRVEPEVDQRGQRQGPSGFVPLGKVRVSYEIVQARAVNVGNRSPSFVTKQSQAVKWIVHAMGVGGYTQAYVDMRIKQYQKAPVTYRLGVVDANYGKQLELRRIRNQRKRTEAGRIIARAVTKVALNPHTNMGRHRLLREFSKMNYDPNSPRKLARNIASRALSKAVATNARHSPPKRVQPPFYREEFTVWGIKRRKRSASNTQSNKTRSSPSKKRRKSNSASRSL